METILKQIILFSIVIGKYNVKRLEYDVRRVIKVNINILMLLFL